MNQTTKKNVLIEFVFLTESLLTLLRSVRFFATDKQPDRAKTYFLASEQVVDDLAILRKNNPDLLKIIETARIDFPALHAKAQKRLRQINELMDTWQLEEMAAVLTKD